MHQILASAATAASVAPSAGQGPLVLYVVAIGSALVAVATYVPKILGPLGKMLSDRAAASRRAAQDVEDTRIVDLTAQLAARSARMAEQDAEITGLRMLIRRIRTFRSDHEAWDWKAHGVLRRTDPNYPAPPPLQDEGE